MRIGILGSGVVGQTLGGTLTRGGHEVVLGTRTPTALEEKRGLGETSLSEWLAKAGGRGRVATFSEAAAHGEVVVNATAGAASLEALHLAGSENLEGKILIDTANPLDFSQGMPPSLTVCNTDSLGEQVQRAYPRARVVKTLNTVNVGVMVAPESVAQGDHHLLLCGDDDEAKRQVETWLRDWFGWQHFVDVGDISAARGTEMFLPIWIRIWGALGTPMFNLKVMQ